MVSSRCLKNGFGRSKAWPWTFPARKQGCQMVYFRTKNTNLGIFYRVLELKLYYIFMTIWNILLPFCIVYGLLVYLVCGHCVYFYRFGMFEQRKLWQPCLKAWGFVCSPTCRFMNVLLKWKWSRFLHFYSTCKNAAFVQFVSHNCQWNRLIFFTVKFYK
jgi:hypothetical protein